MATSPAHPAVTADGWSYQVLDQVDSTNTFAARLPAWTAVRSKTQVAGRGRTPDRRWVSDLGGLWLSAVVPCPGLRSRWETLPLAAGWAVVKAVQTLGASAPRLRWPNDVMVGRAKLAGLLVERYTPETAVIGIGVNVFNRPDANAPELVGQTTRLCSLVCGEYTIDDVAACVLDWLRRGHATMMELGFGPIADELNCGWAGSRRVQVTFNNTGDVRDGAFHGIDERGSLRVSFADGRIECFDATQIALLREFE